MQAAGDVDAVYFQGAVLDVVPVIDRLESELALPVIASNPAAATAKTCDAYFSICIFSICISFISPSEITRLTNSSLSQDTV